MKPYDPDVVEANCRTLSAQSFQSANELSAQAKNASAEHNRSLGRAILYALKNGPRHTHAVNIVARTNAKIDLIARHR